ncbi:IS66 family insertion sequence element accessory protein TnpB [Bradyrhizobium canariense]|uniref:IS66 family insertion sequence element accessory protein TnpB n=1 Tax=Bradyrhizobium canariense TaxID=255045 RepID=UPI000B8F4E12
MIPLPAGVRVWLATGHTDMRKGFPSLALQVQEILHRDPLGGHLFCFRGRRGGLPGLSATPTAPRRGKVRSASPSTASYTFRIASYTCIALRAKGARKRET